MKVSFILFLYFMFMYTLSAQTISFPRDAYDVSVLDSGYMKISYAFNAIDIDDYTTYEDLQLLEIGKINSKYYSHFIYNSDSLVTEWILKNPNSSSIPTRMGIRGRNPLWSEYYFSEYFKCFENNILTEYCRMPNRLQKANAYYDEEIPLMEWEIHEDTLSVTNYLCQLATCHFRGRYFIAWFSIDIPVNNGPWKFSGLPGLILKVSDTEEKYIFECIEIKQSDFQISRHNSYNTYQKISRDKMLKFQKEIHEDYYKVANLIPVWGGTYPPKKVYKAIELE